MNEKAESWKIVSSEKIADCRVFKVREDFCERESDGARHSFFVLENPDWVNIIALTKNDEVVLIEQYRYGTQEIILEIPGGMVDENEDAETAARRELLEETGYSSDEFVFLGKSHPNPAIQDNEIYHYLALNCEKTDETKFDEHESVVTKLVSLAEIRNLILEGKITHSLVVAAFAMFYLREKN
jgi:8-oxo-dGTP pyrophosphatase MutT (NUDIX family)